MAVSIQDATWGYFGSCMMVSAGFLCSCCVGAFPQPPEYGGVRGWSEELVRGHVDTPASVWEQLETRPELVRNWSESSHSGDARIGPEAVGTRQLGLGAATNQTGQAPRGSHSHLWGGPRDMPAKNRRI